MEVKKYQSSYLQESCLLVCNSKDYRRAEHVFNKLHKEGFIGSFKLVTKAEFRKMKKANEMFKDSFWFSLWSIWTVSHNNTCAETYVRSV